MNRRLILIGLVLLGVVMVCAGCSIPALSVPTPPVADTPTPQVIIVVATPTSGAPIPAAEALEAQRVAVYERAAPAVVNVTTQVLRGVIQTDAAINQGNSGGPLLDLQGRLIGVNTAIFSPTGTSAGVGLAIPAEKVKRVVPVLIKDGRYPHPWLGIEELGYELSPALSQALRLPVEHGLLVARLYSNSPADKAGLHIAQREVVVGNRRYQVGGDIITAVDGKALTTWEMLSAYLEEQCRVGQTITLTVIRDGKESTVKATLEDTPDSLRAG